MESQDQWGVSGTGRNDGPTQSFGPLDKVPVADELIGKVVSGCTDPNATNYDEKANTNRGCKYPDGGGNGGGNGEITETNYTPYILGGVVLAAIALFA